VIDFNNFRNTSHVPLFTLPEFTNTSRRLQSKSDDPCGNIPGITDLFVLHSCKYDLHVTDDKDFVIATTEAAVVYQEYVTVLNNTAPRILEEGRNQNATIEFQDYVKFTIKTNDTDNDPITATMVENDADNDLFVLVNATDGVFDLFFLWK